MIGTGSMYEYSLHTHPSKAPVRTSSLAVD